MWITPCSASARGLEVEVDASEPPLKVEQFGVVLEGSRNQEEGLGKKQANLADLHHRLPNPCLDQCQHQCQISLRGLAGFLHES